MSNKVKDRNGLHLEFVNFEEIINKLPIPPIMLNDLECVTKEDRDKINSLIRTNYDGDKLSIQPTCDCGETTVGKFCPTCRQPVLPFSEKPLDPIIWFRPPTGVKSLINPTFWGIIRAAFTHNGYCLLDWITKTTGSPPPSKMGEVASLQKLGIARGFNNFVNNFDDIIETLFEKGFYRGTANNRQYLRRLIAENRHLLFTQYLPIPHKIAFVTEKTSVATYADFSMAGAYNAAITITEIDEGVHGTSLATKQNWTIGAINDLTGYYEDQYKMTIGKKEGANRKHIVGTRGNYGGRAVISSLSNAHDYDELHIPWTFAVGLLKMHLTSKLIKRGHTPDSAARFLIENAERYNAELDGLFQELINEAKDDKLGIKGLPAIFQRNPSLARGSAQCFSITKVKSDVNDKTISMSVLVLAGPNADFDGKHLSSLNSPNCWELLKIVQLKRSRKRYTSMLKMNYMYNGQSAPKSL